jgi:hypothetical protein
MSPCRAETRSSRRAMLCAPDREFATRGVLTSQTESPGSGTVSSFIHSATETQSTQRPNRIQFMLGDLCASVAKSNRYHDRSLAHVDSYWRS